MSSTHPPRQQPPADPISSTRSVLVPAPVPLVNPWTQKKSVANIVNKQAPLKEFKDNVAPESKKEALKANIKKEELEDKENGNGSKTGFSLNNTNNKLNKNSGKWVPFTEAEIELSTNKQKSKSKSKKKKSKNKSKDTSNDFGEILATSKVADQNKSEDDLKVGSQESSQNATPAYSSEKKEIKAVVSIVTPETKNVEVEETKAEGNELKKRMETLSVDEKSDDAYINNYNGSDDTVGEKKESSYQRNNFKQKYIYKQRRNENPGQFHGNVNLKHKNNGYRNYYGSSDPRFNAYFAQPPFAAPLYPNTMGFAGGNPIFPPPPPPPNQMDPNLRINDYAGSAGSFNDVDSAASSNSPSRRASSVGQQAPLPTFLPQSKQMFYNNGMMPPNMGQAPFIPQFPPQMMPPNFQQPYFIPPPPQMPLGMPMSPLPDYPMSPNPFNPRMSEILKQVSYYFSEANLKKDKYLKQLMNKSTGGINLESFLEFRRLKILVFGEYKEFLSGEEKSEGLQTVRDAISNLPYLELIEEGNEVRLREGWEKWVTSEENGSQV